mgnify:CR=1 FL=1
MTETNTHIAEAIATCNEIKARLETLQDMLKPKPVLCLESITRPGIYRELQSADDLISCAPGTIVVTPNTRFFRTCDPANPWTSIAGCWVSNGVLWSTLVGAANSGATLKYLGAF